MRIEKSLKKNLNIKVFLLYFKFYRIFFSKNSYINFLNLYKIIFVSFFKNYQKVVNNFKAFLLNSGVIYNSLRLGGDVLSIKKNLKFSNVDEYSTVNKSLSITNIKIFSRKYPSNLRQLQSKGEGKFYSKFLTTYSVSNYVLQGFLVKILKAYYIFF